jgi:hypothetical protein
LDPYDPSDTNDAALEHDVRTFYKLLRDKQWPAAYDMRAKAFRETCPKAAYLRMAEEEGKDWGLANYEVLSAEMDEEDDSGSYTAVLICKFVELPGDAVSYSTVYWHNEDGSWKCLNAGPKGMDIFSGGEGPYINWR